MNELITKIFLQWFPLWFPALLIIVPMTIALLVRPKPHPDYTADEQHHRSRKYTFRLCVGTLGALVLHLGLWSTPLHSTVKTLPWLLFFPLWFFLSLPLLQIKDAGWMGAARLQGSVRVANLQGRLVSASQYWTLFGVASAGMIALLAISAPFLPDPLRLFLYPRVFLLFGSLFFLGLGLITCRLTVVEPEPFTEQSIEELERGYTYFRQTRKTLSLVMFLMVAIFLEIFALISLTPLDSMVLVWTGSISGFAFGILGAVIGMWSSFKRAALNRMLVQDQSADGA